jgi:glycosyltransferase involved in cell wall biosynthesis
MPRVTICVSVRDEGVLLQNCLKHIYDQTFKDWECIVVDDGSTESLEPVVKEFRDDRFLFHRFPENRGIPKGANYAYKLATGDYIGSLGVDELISPDKLAVQVKFLDDNPQIGLVWGVPGNGPMGPVESWEQYALKAHNRSRYHWLKCFLMLEGVPVGGASALWRKSLFDSIGYFDESLSKFSDHEWFCRVLENHNVYVLPYRFMNEVTRPTTNPVTNEKAQAEYDYVRSKHSLVVPPSEGLITVAIPLYNHEKFVGQAIEAVLAQTDQNFEILIMDDCSTDKSAEVIKKYQDPRIHYFRSEANEGQMPSVNKLLKMAKGEFFISCSSDDTIDPTLFAKLRAEFIKDPFLEHVACQNDFIDEEGKPYTADHPFKTIEKAVNRSQEEWINRLYNGNVYFGMAMYRMNALSEVGVWEPKHGVISDYEMYLRLLPRYNFRIVEEPLTHTRIHGKNLSLLSPEEGGKLRRRYFDAQKPYYRPIPKVVIATPFYELKGFSPYIASLTNLARILTANNINWEFFPLDGDSYVSRARNSICMTFLDDPYATDLFFIDSDQSWNPEAFMGILFRPEPVVAGTYPVKNKWDWWTSRPEIADAETNPHFMGKPLPDGSALLKAVQLAGGFLRIKRSVLEKFIEFYPTHRYYDTHPVPEMRRSQVEFFSAGVDRSKEVELLNEIKGAMKTANGSGVDLTPFKEKFDALEVTREFIGEDYSFSNRLRGMGIELFIYPNATITHFGIQGWTGNFNSFLLDQKKKIEEAKVLAEKGA